ncbi:MAG: CPBP family intramembrane glutamic endopeptidase [Candidatus Limnocylindria bacterium]
MDRPGPEGAWNAEPPADPDRDVLSRHRALQVISVVLIVGGLVLPSAAILANPELVSGSSSPETVQRLIGPLLMLALGGLALIVGLVLNTVRALIVRSALPPGRYRGPAVFVLLMLATILGVAVSLIAASTAIAIVNGGELSVGGTLVQLTSTQVGLLAVTGGLVVAPRTLAGLRLLPASHAWRSMAIGLALAIPAWVGVSLLANLCATLLEALGFPQETGIVSTVMERGDPTVLVLAIVLVAPIAEEIFFRGVVYNAWEREYGTRVAVLGSAALFALIHGSLVQLLPIFILGIALALLYRSTRSLPATMAMHAGFNAITVVIVLLDRLGVLKLPT